MELKEAFGATLRQARLQKGLTQEHFSLVSSRTNVSLLERGGTSPTLAKLEELCGVLGVHPVSLITACYMRKENITDLKAFLARVRNDLKAIDSRQPLKEG
jgi:transcriptional regulator with XRE-family HTH domain